MNPVHPVLLLRPLAAVLALSVAGSVCAQALDRVAPGQSAFDLIEPRPLASLAPAANALWRVEAAAGLGDRHQLRFATSTLAHGSLPGTATPGAASFGSRATWRYTVHQQPSWTWRVGLTTAFGDRDPRSLSGERPRFGSRPLLHVAGEGSFARRWLLGVDADTLMTARGHGLELGLRVSYQLAPNLALTGGYRLTEAGGSGEELYAPGLTNSANVGLRLRF
jgi:hypothetical protein